MAQPLLTHEIEMLRVRLESTVSMPTVIVISAALDDGSKTATAEALAQSVHVAGYSTLLIRSDESAPPMLGSLEPKTLDEFANFGFAPYLLRGARSGFEVLPLPNQHIERTTSRATMVQFAQLCRSSYQVTIVEVTTGLANPFATLAAVVADGVLLTVRQGRRVRPEDRSIVATLVRENVAFLGVVPIAGVQNNARWWPAAVEHRKTPRSLPNEAVGGRRESTV